MSFKYVNRACNFYFSFFKKNVLLCKIKKLIIKIKNCSMIQRIQSIFLFVSMCFMVSMFFVPIAELAYETGEILAFDFTGFYVTEAGMTTCISKQYSIMTFGILICALNFVTIFMYKSRLLQLRLCIYNILLLAGIMGVTFFVLYNVQNVLSISFRLSVVFPVIAIILHYLAFRGIRNDELMVQALSRLR